jgi:UDP-glucose 4-epimerase
MVFLKLHQIYSISRLFNVFGPRQLPNSPYSGVISIFESAMQQNQPLTIYGDGSQTRDFIYVKDVAIAFERALTTPIKTGKTLTCNVGTRNSISLVQLVSILKNCFPNWASEIRFAPARTGDIQHSQADISKATSYLDFRPRWSVQEGMQRFVESHSFSARQS